MLTVIDIGCAKYGGDESIPYLIEEFSPDLLWGFDPNAKDEQYELNGCKVTVEKKVVWTYSGVIGFNIAATSGRVDEKGHVRFPCVDILSLVNRAAGNGEVIVKMDAEGAEYEILPHLRDNRTDRLLRLLWVEPHCRSCGNGGGHREGCQGTYNEYEELEASMRCEMHRWNR